MPGGSAVGVHSFAAPVCCRPQGTGSQVASNALSASIE